MTMIEKKEILNRIMVDFCAPCRAKEDGCENCEFLAVMNEAAKAIEKSEKYKWHDLKKDSEDLPRTEEPVIATIKFCGIGSEYMKPICYTEGVYELFFKRWNLAEDHKWHDEYNPYVSYEVLAWRYIEPFEEGDTE